MNAQQRREAILQRLLGAAQPVSAASLANRLSVSRQVIVNDIALLRAGGAAITATPRGYVIPQSAGILRQVVCRHRGEEMEAELNAIVDLGCSVVDVSVEHPIYGRLTGELRLSCRADVALFIEKVRGSAALPLSLLTEGVHIHTLSCPTEESFLQARSALEALGVLLSEG